MIKNAFIEKSTARPKSSSGKCSDAKVEAKKYRPRSMQKHPITATGLKNKNYRKEMTASPPMSTITMTSDMSEWTKLGSERADENIPRSPIESYNNDIKLKSISNFQPSDPDDGTTMRIDRIMKFLKSVEQADDSSSMTTGIHSGISRSNLTTDSSEFTFTPEQSVNTSTTKSSEVFEDIKTKMNTMQMELEEKLRTQKALKAELRKAKESLKDEREQNQKDVKTKLDLQRKEYETISKRHLKFIDKLLAEKEDLTNKCSTLGDEVKRLEKQFKDKISYTEEQYKRDIKQQKDIWSAAEKVKREKWITEKSKMIKDNTIKGLEPEIQRMLTQHKQQMRVQEERLRSEFYRDREELISLHEKKEEQLRQKIKQEREQALEEEREFIRQRYQKQYEQDIFEHQQQRRSLLAEFEEQKTKLTQALRQESERSQDVLRRKIEEQVDLVSSLKREHEEANEELRRKHQKELALNQEKLRIDKDQWQTHQIHKQTMMLREKEKQIREQAKSERDADIQLIVERLENENAVELKEHDRRHWLEMEKVKSEHMEQLKVIKEDSNQTRAKCLALQQELADAKDMQTRTNETVNKYRQDLDKQIILVKEKEQAMSDYHNDKERLREAIRGEFVDQLSAKDDAFDAVHRQWQNAEAQIRQERDSHRLALEHHQKQKEEALHMVEDRVRQTIYLKEEQCQALRRQLEEASMRTMQLEHLIEKQRKELLT